MATVPAPLRVLTLAAALPAQAAVTFDVDNLGAPVIEEADGALPGDDPTGLVEGVEDEYALHDGLRGVCGRSESNRHFAGLESAFSAVGIRPQCSRNIRPAGAGRKRWPRSWPLNQRGTTPDRDRSRAGNDWGCARTDLNRHLPDPRSGASASWATRANTDESSRTTT